MPRSVLIVCSALLMSFVTFAAPVEAQSRRELAARLDAVEARLAEVEARALQGDPVAETLMMRVDGLEREQRVLTGEVERLGFENRRLRQELEQMGVNVDRLLSGGAAYGPAQGGDPLSLGGPSLLTSDEMDPEDPYAEARAETVQGLQMPSPGTNTQALPADDFEARPAAQDALDAEVSELVAPAEPMMDADTLYQAANSRLLGGDFGGAREMFRDFTTSYPDHGMAGQAHYWLGETYFINGDFQDAADAYIASLQTERQGPRAPDALIRLGASFAALGQSGQACQVLATFPAEFPRASEDARRKAQREVARIGCR